MSETQLKTLTKKDRYEELYKNFSWKDCILIQVIELTPVTNQVETSLDIFQQSYI